MPHKNKKKTLAKQKEKRKGVTTFSGGPENPTGGVSSCLGEREKRGVIVKK